jgi:hypothetical protein
MSSLGVVAVLSNAAMWPATGTQHGFSAITPEDQQHVRLWGSTPLAIEHEYEEG